MRKISSKQYAVSLYEAIEDKNPKELATVFDNFLKIIRQNKDWKNLNKIIASFVRVYAEKKGLAEAEITSARQLPDNLLATIKKSLAEIFSKEVELTDKVDPKLLGGLIIRYDDLVLDGSLVSKIKALKKNF